METDPLRADMVVLGDSVAQGQDDPSPSIGWIGWPRRLAERLGISGNKVLNVATERATIVNVATEQLEAVRDTDPRIIVLSCGMNDVFAGFERRAVASALDEVLRWACNTGATTIVVAVPIPPVMTQSNISEQRRNRTIRRVYDFNAELYRSAELHRARCFRPGMAPDITDARFWSSDGIHLNSAGHIYVMKNIEKLVNASVGFSVEQ